VKPNAALTHLLASYRLVLVGTQYAGNVGSIARICTNYGLTAVRMVAPQCAWKEGEALLYARSHSKAVLESFQECATLEEGLQGSHFSVGFSRRRGDLRNPNITLDEISRLAQKGEVSLVFGCEESGLSTEDLLGCTHICSLPTAGIMPSLNLSHACAVVFSRLFQIAFEKEQEAQDSHQGNEEAFGNDNETHVHFAPGGQEVYKELSLTMKRLLAPVNHQTFESLMIHWRSVMVSAGLTEQGNPDRMLADMRRMFQRCALTERDANILHGVLSAVERTWRKQDRNPSAD
jgi:TrmH family RNA methyltransferase